MAFREMTFRKAVTVLGLAVIGLFFCMPCQVSANLVAYYKFDGNVSDETGQHPGTLYGTTNYVAGVVGQALDFSLNPQGQPTYVELANPGTIDFGKDFSISLWLKTTASGQRVFLSKNVTNAWAYPGKQFMTSGQEVLVDCYGSGAFSGDFTSNGVIINNGQWHHVVLTYCATISPYWHWYVDGHEQDSYGRDFTLADDTTNQHLRIGMREDGYNGYFVGQMDEVQVYNQTLTAAQAQYLFEYPGSVITNTLYATNFVNSGNVFPRATKEASTNISTLDVDGLSTPDLFMMLTFQGCINRIQPRIFLIGHGMVEMQNRLSTQFWLDQMPDYTQTPYTNDYAMLGAFTNGLNGCVLYNTSMFNSTADANLARINLVIMLCAKYGAIAVTTNQLANLTDAGITLPVLADARTLGGSTWSTIYSYALTNLAPFMRTDILNSLAGKNGTNFCLGDVDYLVAQKIFSFNVPIGTNATAATVLTNILALTPPNTPVIGCWGLDYGSGEHAFISLLSGVGKFMTVTYETENLSFTTGLPVANIPDQTDLPLVVDTNKVYVAFTESDGDNFSFDDRVFPEQLDVTNRIAYPLGWELCAMANELNPVLAAWFYRNVGTTFVTPCDGVGYEWNWNSASQHPSDPYLATFLRLTDKYMGAMHQSIVRTIGKNYKDALPYGALTNAIGVLIGYTGTGIAVSNVQSADFISRGKAFFQGYNFKTEMTNISEYKGPTPAFFSVGCQYVPIASIVTAANQLPGNFQVVSPNQLASLYRQYKTNEVLASQNIRGAEFSPLDPAELLYLYEDNGSATNGTSGGTRFVDYTNYWIYQFNLAGDVTSVSVALTMYNNYLVSASKDGSNWQVVAQSPVDVHDGSNVTNMTVNLTGFLGGAGNNVYLKFSDAAPDTPWGTSLTHLKLTTISPFSPAVSVMPQSQTVLPGTNVTFNSVASGATPLFYQWYFDVTNTIPNANSANLLLTNVTASQAGAYTLVVSNSAGTASATGDLAIYEPPQYVMGQWLMNEGSGTNLANSSPDNSSWGMTVYGDPNLWGYQQPGAYQFANGGYAATAITSSLGWTSGDTLTLTAKFNVTGNAHDPGTVFGGGGIFGADYFISTGGNSLGYNRGAFYARILTSGAPTIEFDVSSIPPGRWSQALPDSVTNANVNGGWNTAQWVIQNNVAENSMTLQFMLNGTNIGPAVSISGGYLADFTSYSGYTGSRFEIGACGAGYQTFSGALEDVSLIATVPAPMLNVEMSGGNPDLTINGTPGFTYGIQSVDGLTQSNNWQTLTNLTLPISPYIWVDPRQVNGAQRFYRAVVTIP